MGKLVQLTVCDSAVERATLRSLMKVKAYLPFHSHLGVAEK